MATWNSRAVSYTHLDVYKRQEPARRLLQLLRPAGKIKYKR